MRKKHYIKKVLPDDVTFFKIIANSESCQESDALKILSPNRLRSFQKEGLLTRFVSVDNSVIFTLTDKGKRFCTDKIFEHNKLYYSGTSKVHDSYIFHQLSKLSPEQLDTVRSEPELRQEYFEKMEHLKVHNPQEYYRCSAIEVSVPDYFYTTPDGSSICVDIITASYRQHDIELRQQFCDIMNHQFQTFKI